MRVVISSTGSVGDIYPFTLLARALREHKHEVIFALPSHLGALATAAGFKSVNIGKDVGQTYLESQRLEIANENSQRNYVEGIDFTDSVLSDAPNAVAILCDLCKEADVLIGPAWAFTRTVHDLIQIPFVSIAIVYPYERNAEYLEEEVFLINPFRCAHGLQPLLPTFDQLSSSGLHLFAQSRHLLNRSPNWPAHYHITGFFLDSRAEWDVEADLLEFVRNNPALVVITLGSMVHDDPQALTELFVEAIGNVGCKAVIQKGWSGLATGEHLPDFIRSVGFVPHAWLFPHATCIVHHAGAGTLAAALRAKKPSICIPHAWDQFQLAELARQSGCAFSDVIPYRELTSMRVGRAIKETLLDIKYSEAARSLGKQVEMEQGLEHARTLIEAFVRS